MPKRRLGDSDLDVSVVGLGCNNFGGRADGQATRAVVDAALEADVVLFDTADTYGGFGGSERLLGEVLDGRRHQVVLATKFGMDLHGADGMPQDLPRGSREYIRLAIEGSLRRLRTDYVDLYQYHEPDGVTPIEETLGALDELVREGKARAIGCSNFSSEQLVEARAIADREGWAHFVSLQNEYSLLERAIERDVQPTCERLQVGILPYYPLARGLLTGKYRRGLPAPAGTRLAAVDGAPADDETFDAVEALESYATTRGLRLVDVAIAGLAAQPAVASVIAGATRPEQVRSNAEALRWQPSEDDLRELDDLTLSAIR